LITVIGILGSIIAGLIYEYSKDQITGETALFGSFACVSFIVIAFIIDAVVEKASKQIHVGRVAPHKE
jgi:hypothetical protein